jgi:hypothetical protein
LKKKSPSLTAFHNELRRFEIQLESQELAVENEEGMKKWNFIIAIRMNIE